MTKRIKTNRRKGFTLIELIVVMAVLAILVLLAAPKFLGHTKEAQFTKHINNAKVLEDASERYYIDHGKWPRGLDEDVYTAEEVDAYADKIYDITGEELVLEEGKYWDIDYEALATYAKLPDEDERANYVLRNPVGKVYYLEGLTEAGVDRLPIPVDSNDEAPVEPNEPAIPDYYVQATDADFTKDNEGYWRYTGSDDYVILPHEIGGVPIKSYKYLFRGDMYQGVASSPIKGVASDNPNVTDMSHMFYNSKGTSLALSNFDTSQATNMENMFFNAEPILLNLSNFDTSQVTSMRGMFYRSKAKTLMLEGFDTAKVTDMGFMFAYSEAISLNLLGFNTSQVTAMDSMFNNNQATTLDLSNFDTSSVITMGTMFANSQAKELDLTSFDTSGVVYMGYMFYGNKATNLNLSSFDTKNVTGMSYMFQNSLATTLELSSFDLRNITTGTTSNTSKNWQMFEGAAARTGYARTTADAAKLHHSGTSRPTGLTFIVK